MSIQLFQIAQLLIYGLLLLAIYRFKSTKLRAVFIFVGLIIFLFNPIKFKQEGISKIERRHQSYEADLPDRVYVEKKTFDQKQKTQMDELKKQSKEIQNEIN